MSEKYLYIYNNLINFTRNKDLYKSLNRNDNFSDRLTLFLLHFSFFLKNYKNDENKTVLQEIYDFNFRQLELSIREIGYGDQSINKKMKNYLNLFYSMIQKLYNWENLTILYKRSILSIFINNSADTSYLVDYFEKYNINDFQGTLFKRKNKPNPIFISEMKNLLKHFIWNWEEYLQKNKLQF